MNFSHIHLMINHVPIVGIPITLLFLGYGLWARNTATQKFSLMVLLGLAAITLPVYLTGEPAEGLIEHLPGVSESFIAPHEDAAKYSLILTLIAGAAALATLLIKKGDAKFRSMSTGVFGLAGLALISLVYTASLGGQVRHTELRSGFVAPPEEKLDAKEAPGSGDGMVPSAEEKLGVMTDEKLNPGLEGPASQHSEGETNGDKTEPPAEEAD